MENIDFNKIYINQKGDIATPCKFISKEEAKVNFPDQPERSKREDSIPEYGVKAPLNYDEWEKRCGALNSMET